MAGTKVMVTPGARRGRVVVTQSEAMGRARQVLARLGVGELEIPMPTRRIREPRTLRVNTKQTLKWLADKGAERPRLTTRG